MISTRILLMIAAGGALGSVGRYLVTLWSHRYLGAGFPYGTLLVNVTGCLLLGGLTQAAVAGTWLPEGWRLAIAVGLLGGLTTFSTFGYETFVHFEHGRWGVGLGNVAANVLLGLAAVWTGAMLVRFWMPP